MTNLRAKNRLLTLTLCLCCSSLFGQDIELAGGLNKNEFYDNAGDEGHFHSEYITGNGYVFSLSIEDTLFSSFHPKFALTYDHYKGSIYTTDGGLGGSSTTRADVEKTILGLNIYPLDFKIVNTIQLNFGAAFNFLLDQKMIGYHSSWQAYGPNIYNRLDDNSSEHAKDFTFGLIARTAFEIKVSDTWYILPQYLFYFGLTNEFKNIEANTKSWRHYFEIGIAKRLKANQQQ